MKMIKKSFLVILIAILLLSSFFIPDIQIAKADASSSTGLLPKCASRDSTTTCGICDVFQLIVNIINFLLIKIVPPLAVLMLVVGGATFLFSSGNPALVSTGKKILTSTIIGVAVAYGSYLIVGLVLKALHLASWTSEMYHSWFGGAFQINCH